MKSNFLLILIISTLISSSLGCVFYTNNGIIDLNPLKLTRGYYTGSFFDYPPKSFMVLFNICGTTPKCNSLVGSNSQVPQSCVFTPSNGNVLNIGYLSSYSSTIIDGGISLSYGGGVNGTAQLDIYCDEKAYSPNLYDCIRINSPSFLYKCSMYSRYACPKKMDCSLQIGPIKK